MGFLTRVSIFYRYFADTYHFAADDSSQVQVTARRKQFASHEKFCAFQFVSLEKFYAFYFASHEEKDFPFVARLLKPFVTFSRIRLFSLSKVVHVCG